MTEPPLLRLHDLQKSFGGVRALQGVSFELKQGEVHALLGENGAGKSTLIKLVTGAHHPDAGTLEILGQKFSSLDPALARSLGIACIYQQPALFPDLTVAENIWLRLKRPSAWSVMKAEEGMELAQKWLREIGSSIDPKNEVAGLSMPEQQLVEIACALGIGAKILIMDEPTSSLTRPEQERLFSLIGQVRQSGVGVIYISHRLEEIFALADRVTVLRDGQSVGTFFVRPSNTQTKEETPISEEALIRLMVGHDLETVGKRDGAETGPVALRLNQLTHQPSGVGPIDLELRAGEVLGMAGMVGARRTELARVLFGLKPADGGHLEIFGQARVPQSPMEAIAAGIGYVPEDRRRHGVILEMPVSHNLTLPLLQRLFPGTWIRPSLEEKHATEFIRRLKIKSEGSHSAVATLSGGNQQKVSLGRWLGMEPRILILDEPTQGVDVGAKSEFHQIIRDLAGQGLAVLLISSDLHELILVSDRIAVMRQGQIRETFSPPFQPHALLSVAMGTSRRAA